MAQRRKCRRKRRLPLALTFGGVLWFRGHSNDASKAGSSGAYGGPLIWASTYLNHYVGIVLNYCQYGVLYLGSYYNTGPYINYPHFGNSNLGKLPCEELRVAKVWSGASLRAM